MAQIDFAIAFVVVFTMITYSIFIVSGTISKDFEYFNEKEIGKAQDSLSKQLFEILDDKSLVSNFKKIDILFEDIGGYPHIETIMISIKPIMNKIHVYNQTRGITKSKELMFTNLTIRFQNCLPC